MRQILYFLIILSTIAVFGGKSFGGNFEMQKQAKVRAPEFTGARGWLNVDKPLSIAGLKGKVVLLDFWTYGCINCVHIIPDLKKLEAKYGNNLVVIGVHSAKFDNEKNTENIRRIVLRYGIEHPIVNDADFKIWEAYAVKAWPTLVLIDPAGYIVGQVAGEGHYEVLDRAVGKTIDEFRQKGQLSDEPVRLALERAKVGSLPLAFPGKVLADEKSKRLFISDSNHNRIVVTDFNGKLFETIGDGRAAADDGGFDTASFNRPQGLALDGETLYVADTENHSIRRVDLKSKRVDTVAGTGRIEGFDGAGGEARKVALRSPWDLSLVVGGGSSSGGGRWLYVAMAGSHQIWRMNLEKNVIEPYAGTQAEARLDGGISEAGFAQPSGIASDGKSLYVADSESNIIREIDFARESVETLVGGDLFQFGDKDGEGDDVRLQHPLGVVLYNEKILIADTYNHRIKRLDPKKRTVTSFLGSGKPGQLDGGGESAQFYEPGGLSVAGEKLFIADTNNQAIRVADLRTGRVSTLKIAGLAPPKEVSDQTAETPSPNAKEIKLPVQEIAADSPGTLNFQITLPKDFHLNPSAPQSYEITVENGANIKIINPKRRFTELPVSVPFLTAATAAAAAGGTASLKARLTIFYCREDNTGVCLIKTLRWQVPLKITAGDGGSGGRAENKITLSETVDP